MPRLRFQSALLLFVTVGLAASPASAQTDYPSRTVIVVAFEAGGRSDVIARLLAPTRGMTR
jgi:tripartite-type tricarboxylate transporter receptor subunit TctC